jgi:Rps23 Pro-64 3,4-dihydroxylase Tpa1-like proline 4-hydroxylase
MNVPLGPKYVVIDDFLAGPVLAEIENHARSRPEALELKDFGGAPQEGHYSALRKLWVHTDGLGPAEADFRAAIAGRFDELRSGTGIPPFELAAIETEVCAQRPGSFFARHIDTDTRDATPDASSDRMISAVFYFPREPLAFSGGELVLYDFTGQVPTATIAPRRNRLVAFPSFATHEVTPLAASEDDLASARWSVNCWLHRSRPRPGDPVAS